eukprot:603320-Lingulodinium_polyedra.AAC.1
MLPLHTCCAPWAIHEQVDAQVKLQTIVARSEQVPDLGCHWLLRLRASLQDNQVGLPVAHSQAPRQSPGIGQGPHAEENHTCPGCNQHL